MTKDRSTAADQDDVEDLADALLAAVQQDIENTAAAEPRVPDAFSTALVAMRRLGTEFVRRYNRLELETEPTTFDGPVLFVANHGFGGIFDLNVLAISSALEQLDLDRPVTVLTHQLAWTIGIGPVIELFGARPASHESAREAVDNDRHILVLPGGDLDAFKVWEDRNQIIFSGRAGFARLAIEHQLPIVPIVTAGAGESLLVLSNGERLSKALRLDKLLRIKALPVTVSLPWGVSVGAAGMLPYLPLPTKLRTRTLPAMTPEEGEEPDAYACRVQDVMQQALTDMTKNRTPLIG